MNFCGVPAHRAIVEACEKWQYPQCFMITSIDVSNYRSLGSEVRMRLGPLTALVGPNGAGKSNVADLIRFLAEALTLVWKPPLPAVMALTPFVAGARDARLT